MDNFTLWKTIAVLMVPSCTPLQDFHGPIIIDREPGYVCASREIVARELERECYAPLPGIEPDENGVELYTRRQELLLVHHFPNGTSCYRTCCARLRRTPLLEAGRISSTVAAAGMQP